VNNKLGELGCLLGDFTNAGSGILADLDVNVLEAVKNSWENLSFNNNFGKINGVLCDLSKALANVSLKLGVGVRDKSSEVWDCTLVDDSLS